MSTKKNRFYLFLRIFISLFLLALLFWIMRDKLGQIASTIKSANLIYATSAFLIYIFSIFILGLRLQKVLSVQDIRLSVKEAIYLCFLGCFFNNFLPTAIGGDVVKAYYAGKISNKKAAAFSGVFMDRILAMLPFTFIPACALIFAYKSIDNPAIIYIVLFMFIFTMMTLAVLLNKRIARLFRFVLKPFRSKEIYHKITEIYNLFNVYWHHKIVLLWSFSLSLIGQVLFVAAVFMLAKSIGVHNLPLGIFLLLIPIVGVISMAPSLSGHGVREAGIVYMFKDYIPADTAFALSLLALAMLLGVSLIGGLIYAFKKDIYNFKPETEAEVL